MRRLILTIAFAAVPVTAIASGADGVWKTEANDDGGYVQVTVGPCASDASKTCGTISKAFNKQGEDPTYANLGRLIIKDMKSDDGTNYSGGTIWDPEHDKIYKAKMELKGNELDVEGCVSFFCSGEHWARVK